MMRKKRFLMSKAYFIRHPLTWVVFLGFSLRVYGVDKFPVLHDEIISILDGVNKGKESLTHFLFTASIENTVGIMPLYFWIERLFTDILGQDNWGLRTFPLISGILSMCLIYWIVKRSFNKNVALLSAFIVAFSDNFIWVTSKAQFFEVILIPLSFLVFYFVIEKNRNKYFFISLLFSLMLFTYFGKGFLLVLVFLFWYGLTKLFDWLKLKISLKTVSLNIKKELLQFSSFFLFPLFWLIAANFFVFSKGPIENVVGLGKIESIWKILFLTTFGYGSYTKQFLAGSPRGAFLVFDNIHAWPVTSLLFIPFIFGLILLIYQSIIHWKDGDSLFKRDAFLLVSLLPLFLIIFKGIISARFHLLYFLPFVIISSLGIYKVFQLLKEGKILLPFIFALSFGIYGSYVSSWKNWYYFVFDWHLFYKIVSLILIFIAFYFAIGIFAKINRKIFSVSFLIVFLSIIATANFYFGPLSWGVKAAWEPAYDNKLAPASGYYLEGDEETIIDFALEKNKPEICGKLPLGYQERCLDNFKK